MGKKWDLAVIGGGPGGYIAALRGAQLKKKVVLIEEHKIGGTCMNYGCIPAKYLLHETKLYKDMKDNKSLTGPVADISLDWNRIQQGRKQIIERLVKGIEFVLKRNGVQVINGTASLLDARKVRVVSDGKEDLLEAEKIILATGSRSSDLPFLKPDGKDVITSTEALAFESIPRSLLIIGAGAVGLEMGVIYRRLGTEVTILEIMPTILPGNEKDIVNRLGRLLKQQGLKIFTQVKIENAEVGNSKVKMTGISLKDQTSVTFEAEKTLLATGRIPNSEFLEDRTGIELDKRRFVKADSRMETNLKGVFAIGDLVNNKLLAHKASHEGIIAAENAAGLKGSMNYDALPMAVFTAPEFASVGLTSEEAEKRGVKIDVGMFTLQASGRALTMGKIEGVVKVMIGPDDRILGAHILSPNASEIITEITVAMTNRLKVSDVFSAVHIHPTLSEAVMEAALKSKNKAFHVLNES